MMDILLLIPVLLPIVAGLPVFKMQNDKFRRVYISAILIINAAFVVGLAIMPDLHISLWTISDTMIISLSQDNVSRFFAVIISVVWMLVAFFAYEYIRHEGREALFLGFYTITSGFLMGLCYSGNLITLYMFFELMTVFTVPLVIHNRSLESRKAGIKYLGYSIFGAGLGLAGLFFLNRYAGGNLIFQSGGILRPELYEGHVGLILFVTFIMVVGFAAKAGMIPLQAWLPTAHPVAPAPASAVLSGVITKAGVLAIIRVLYYMVGPDLIRGTWVQYALIILALVTVFSGSMLAFKEKLLKKRLAYSTVSQVSYILFGLFLLTPDGVNGALLQVVFHVLAKNALFLCAGAIIFKTEKTYVYELKGMGKRMPVIMWCFTLASLSLIGIPPFGGFYSKWFLATGAITPQFGALGIVGAAVLLISALLTAGYLLPIVRDAFFPGDDFDCELAVKCEPKATMVVPIAIMSALTLILGIIPFLITCFTGGITTGLF